MCLLNAYIQSAPTYECPKWSTRSREMRLRHALNVSSAWQRGLMDMHSALAQPLKRQNLVVTRRQALALGVTNDAIHRMTRLGGRWQRLLPGVYLTVTGTPTELQRETAALLYAGRGGTLTGQAALRRHGLTKQAPQVIDVLIPVERLRKSTGFVRINRTARLPEKVCYEGPVQFAFPARAVADAARDLTDLREVRALVAAAVQTRQCTVGQLREELMAGPMRGSALFRSALAEVIQGARSGPEAELVTLLRRARLPMPMLNARLYLGDRLLARPDAWWPAEAVAVEVDSKEWHLSPDSWEQTMRRHARMTALGILVLHVTPRQIKQEPQEVITTIRIALTRSRERDGTPVRTVAAA